MQSVTKILTDAARRPALFLALGLLAGILVYSGCSTPSASNGSGEDPALRVVATTNIIADWVDNVAGDRVEIQSLLPVGGDVHTYQPGAGDVAQIADADLIVTNGLELEGNWLEELIRNASPDESRIVTLGDAVNPIPYADDAHDDHEDEHEDEDEHDEHEDEDEHDEHEDEDEHDEHEDEDEHDEHEDEDEHDEHEDEDEHDEHEDEDEHDEHEDEDEHDEHEDEDEHDEHAHGAFDPHFWFDPNRVKLAVNVIAERLSALDPDGAATYRANAEAYVTRLDELHEWTEEQVSVIPADRRMLVTSHDSLGYFAALYDFKIIGTVIPSGTTEVEPSAEHVSELTELITEVGVPAVFGETTVTDRIARNITQETGAQLVSLYSGSLGPAGSGADTYIGMARSNVESIVRALR